jgi:hypothetical protein
VKGYSSKWIWSLARSARYAPDSIYAVFLLAVANTLTPTGKLSTLRKILSVFKPGFCLPPGSTQPTDHGFFARILKHIIQQTSGIGETLRLNVNSLIYYII